MATEPTTLARAGGGQQGQIIDTAAPIVAPVLGPPLIVEPVQSNPPPNVMGVGPLEMLIGTWTNQNIGSSGMGGPASPFSYNLMVLPQSPTADPTSPYGYILKNNTYYEEITFSPVNGGAANRGGDGTQVVNALTYEQRVYFADGPAINQLVHFENGIWGFLVPQAQQVGPYGDGNGPDLGTETFGPVPPPLQYQVFKQISIPHGNSVLACGGYGAVTPGAPTIEAEDGVPVVAGLNTDVYFNTSVENPIPAFAQNPNAPLVAALAEKTITQFLRLDVNTDVGGGATSNIAFEQQRAEVTQYYATYWIEDDGSGTFDQLQYTQTILLQIPIVIDGVTTNVSFPHITTNTLTRVATALS